MTTNLPLTEKQNEELVEAIKEFNDTSSIPQYKFESEQEKALKGLMDGMRGLYKKKYSPEKIAQEIQQKFKDHPILSKINARNVRKALSIELKKQVKKENND